MLRDDLGPDLFLSPTEMRQVLHKDKVSAQIIRTDRKGRPEAHILELLDRPQRSLVGRIVLDGKQVWIAPEDIRYHREFLVAKNQSLDAQEGQVVVAEILGDARLSASQVISAKITEVLGNSDDSGMEIEIAVRKFDVPHEFSPECEALCAKLPDVVRPTDKRGRIDLRDVPLVTIDGEDARDFDDAVYCEPAKVGKSKGWRLIVAIADVSHYVKSNDAIDKDAYERATSVYFPRRVIPMLPEKLSNGLCSLKPNVERMCMVCDMMVNSDGEITAYQFYPAVMLSHARFTYTEVAAILANTKGREALQYAARVPDLLNLHSVYEALLKSRAKRGAVDFETKETQIVCDENGRIEKIVPRVRNVAHKLIEEAMLAANVCCAEFIEQAKHPALFRVHEGPTAEKINNLRNYLKSLGLNLSISDDPSTAEMAEIAHATKDRTDATQIHTMLLRSMQQAIYTPHNNGHFGLAYEAYSHFTSPIRRYPDLLAHRAIKAILKDDQYSLPSAHTYTPRPGVRQRPPAKEGAKNAKAPAQSTANATPKDLKKWEAVGMHCSANERRADEASRDVEAWLKCTYMQGHLGEVMSGTVTAATGFGIFVTLDQVSVEGLVHITELGGEYFRFDEARQELRGERSGMRYSIGTKVVVQVAKVDLEGRRIDLALVPNDALIGSIIGSNGMPKSGVKSQPDGQQNGGNGNANGKNFSQSNQAYVVQSPSSKQGSSKNISSAKKSKSQANFLVDAPGPFVSPAQAAKKGKSTQANKRTSHSGASYSANSNPNANGNGNAKSKPLGKANPIAKAKANAKASAKANSKASAKSGVKEPSKSLTSGAKKRR